MRASTVSNLKNLATLILFVSITLGLCIYYTPLYTEGDQYYYNQYYENVRNFNFINGYEFYNNTIGAFEPFYYTVTYIVSYFEIKKEIFFTIINILFSITLIKLLMRMKVNYLISLSFVFNYYYIVLLFSAERLKFALFIFILSFFILNKYSRLIVMILSFFSHFQILLLVYLKLVNEIKKFISNTKSFTSKLILLVIASGIFFGLLFLMRRGVISKLTSYANVEGTIENVAKPIVFVLFSVLLSPKNKVSIVVKFIPLIIASIILGHERIVIFCYFLFIYNAILYKKTSNILVIITSFYFFCQGISFLNNIKLYGNGFM